MKENINTRFQGLTIDTVFCESLSVFAFIWMEPGSGLPGASISLEGNTPRNFSKEWLEGSP
jgi:hypothetical protein